MNYDEILDFHNMDDKDIVKEFNKVAINIENKLLGNMILEIPRETKQIIADLIKRNSELEERIEQIEKDNLIAERLWLDILGKRENG